jgi:hypothetical protein
MGGKILPPFSPFSKTPKGDLGGVSKVPPRDDDESVGGESTIEDVSTVDDSITVTDTAADDIIIETY